MNVLAGVEAANPKIKTNGKLSEKALIFENRVKLDEKNLKSIRTRLVYISRMKR